MLGCGERYGSRSAVGEGVGKCVGLGCGGR